MTRNFGNHQDEEGGDGEDDEEMDGELTIRDHLRDLTKTFDLSVGYIL